MIAPTHIAYSLAFGSFLGITKIHATFLSLGAILPDIDHPRSFIGRLFFFLSVPIHKKFSHRKELHSYFLWGAITLLGNWYKPLLFIGAGAMSHIFLDSHNVAGVHALKPFSEIVCVNFKKDWRVLSGSQKDILLGIIFTCLAVLGFHISSQGGMSAAIGDLLGSYQIAYEQYLKQETRICYLEGKLRYANGKTENGQWKIIGKEGSHNIALWDKSVKKILHIPIDAQFLKAKLVLSDKHWNVMTVGKNSLTRTEAFYFHKQWKYAKAGDLVSGMLVAEKIDIVQGEGKQVEGKHGQAVDMKINFNKIEEISGLVEY